MTLVGAVAFHDNPRSWEILPMLAVVRQRREVGRPELPLIGVSLDGVRPRYRDDGRPAASDDLSTYKIVRQDDIMMNALGKPHGSIGRATTLGITSPAYWVLTPTSAVEPRFLHHLLRSNHLVNEYQRLGKNQPPNQFDLGWTQFRAIEVPMPGREEQRRIADFLDDQAARIDNVIAARERQVGLISEARTHAAWRALSGSEIRARKPSGLGWLGTIPADWPMTTVHAAYEVMLGKMLDESRFTGRYPMPYLRNTNVQWDRVSTNDLKVMDIEPKERDRFTVRRGDLLICEGGQPGRSAVWDGSIAPIGYQKALHRARPRCSNDVRWLQAVLRVAVALSVFNAEFGQATIGHLTGEQLRSLRLPMPPPDVQRARSNDLEDELRMLDSGQEVLLRSAVRLEELKRSLITAVVTGKFDVSSADGSRVPA